MTDKEIIEMAEQAGYIDLPLVTRSMELKELRAFANLVAEKERRACARICAESGMWDLVHEIEGRGQE